MCKVELPCSFIKRLTLLCSDGPEYTVCTLSPSFLRNVHLAFPVKMWYNQSVINVKIMLQREAVLWLSVYF